MNNVLNVGIKAGLVGALLTGGASTLLNTNQKAEAHGELKQTYTLTGKSVLDRNNNEKLDSVDKDVKYDYVKLYKLNSKNKEVLVKKLTNNKSYKFTGLTSGKYVIEVDAMVNDSSFNAKTKVNVNKNVIKNMLYPNFNVIQGTVYNDKNKNKIWDAFKIENGDLKLDELGINKVKVQLLDSKGKVLENVTTKTDVKSKGTFEFKYLGQFKGKTVKVLPVKGYTFTTPQTFKIDSNNVEMNIIEFGMVKK